MQYLEKKEIKEIQLALLDYIDETCKKHNIPYFSVMEPCLELFATKVWFHNWENKEYYVSYRSHQYSLAGLVEFL